MLKRGKKWCINMEKVCKIRIMSKLADFELIFVSNW